VDSTAYLCPLGQYCWFSSGYRGLYGIDKNLYVVYTVIESSTPYNQR
jgi:hypothetical protein